MNKIQFRIEKLQKRIEYLAVRQFKYMKTHQGMINEQLEFEATKYLTIINQLRGADA